MDRDIGELLLQVTETVREAGQIIMKASLDRDCISNKDV